MSDKKETWAVPPELILDDNPEEPVFNLDVDRFLRPADFPVPDRIESLSELESSPDFARLDLLPIDEPVQLEEPVPPESWLEPRIDTRGSHDTVDQLTEGSELRPGNQSGMALALKNYPSQSSVLVAGQNQEKHVIFGLAGTKYTMLMSQVIEVGELNTYTRIPNVPDWVLGVTNLHGDIVSIVDIRALLGLEREEYLENYNLLVTQTFEGDVTAALVVEQVLGIASISAAQIQVVETTAEDGLTSYVRGVYNCSGELLTVINLEGLLRSLDVVH